MTGLRNELLALSLAEDVDTGRQRSDADCVCTSRDPVFVVHGGYDVLHYCRAAVVVYFGGAKTLQVFVVLG